jgi:hypothetical protein
MRARPERNMAAARVKTAPVTPVATVSCQLDKVLAIGCGATVGAPLTLTANAQGGHAAVGQRAPMSLEGEVLTG